MIRLTGGVFRGRFIQVPNHFHTRPTQAKLRQALFNSIQSYIPDARVLDLFAGSGALGFEALSRGASHLTCVEESRSTAKLIQKNIELLEVFDQVKVISLDIQNLLVEGQNSLRSNSPFDLILADPPYGKGWEEKLLNQFPWETTLVEGGLFCLEWGIQKVNQQKPAQSALPDQVSLLEKIREKTYGDSVLTTYKRVQK